MSRALARDQRLPKDAYYTPDDLAWALVRVLPVAAGDLVWEPHVGEDYGFQPDNLDGEVIFRRREVLP